MKRFCYDCKDSGSPEHKKPKEIIQPASRITRAHPATPIKGRCEICQKNFTFLRAINAVNSDLVNNLGNLLHRACHSKLNPRQKYPGFDLEVMEHELKGAGEGLVLELKTLRERVGNHYNNLLFFRGLETINETVKKANAFFNLQAPWNLKQGPEVYTVLFIVCETVRIATILLQPVVPDYADKALSRLGMSKDERHLGTAVFGGGPTMKIYGRPLGKDIGVLMNRIDSRDSTLFD
uniref:Methionine--tRNA ligase, mitochondrial n=1 Tax=Ditylenchus dipsaci TaxID=166011 RepID=A0A915EQ79_9BILA